VALSQVHVSESFRPAAVRWKKSETIGQLALVSSLAFK